MVENRWGEFRVYIGGFGMSVVDEVVHCGLTSLEYRSMTLSYSEFLGQVPGGTLH